MLSLDWQIVAWLGVGRVLHNVNAAAYVMPLVLEHERELERTHSSFMASRRCHRVDQSLVRGSHSLRSGDGTEASHAAVVVMNSCARQLPRLSTGARCVGSDGSSSTLCA